MRDMTRSSLFPRLFTLCFVTMALLVAVSPLSADEVEVPEPDHLETRIPEHGVVRGREPGLFRGECR